MILRIYTDGSFNKYTQRSGYGIVFCIGKRRAYLNGYTPPADTCRTELLAVVVALQQLPQASQVQIYTDSKYVIKGGRGNADLWYELRKLQRKHRIQLFHVKAHSGHELNELAHGLARNATRDRLENTLWWRYQRIM